MPAGPDDAQAYTEAFLAKNPRAELRPELLAVAQLESGRSAADTCRARNGVDCLPYVFEQSTLLTLAAGDAPQALAEMVLRSDAGEAVLAAPAGGAPVSAVIEPGTYVLELHRAAGGGEGSALVFVRPDDADAAASAALAMPGEAAPNGAAMHTATLTATRDCFRCKFNGADLRDQSFDGATLSESTFDGALMSNTTFRGATMIDCSLRDLRMIPLRGVAFDADFTRATMSFSHFSFLVESPYFVFTGIFREAVLDETMWKAEGADQNLCKQIPFAGSRCSLLNPDFRNANLRLARFPAVRLQAGFDPKSRHRCTFQGADLEAANFRPEFPRTVNTLSPCRFDREPESGRVTSFRRASLAQVAANHYGNHTADFSDADFTDAILSLADFGGPKSDPRPGNGAIMRRANFTRATMSGVRFVGADLTDATIADLTSDKFIDPDLRFARLSGAKFTGSVLARADFGPALPFTHGVPNFTGAILTDGSRGVSFAGQTFPLRYGGLKGLDLTRANLTGADLLEANLEGTTLNSAEMVGVNLTYANLTRAKLRGAFLGVTPGEEKRAASLHGALMPSVDLTDADLRSVNLSDAHLYGTGTSLIRTRLDSANFAGAVCSGVRFGGSLNNTVFDKAQLVNAVFNGATLTNTKFDSAYLQGADFSAAIGGTGVSLVNAAISAAPGNWTYREQNGMPFTYRYEATKLGLLASLASVDCPNGRRGPCCESGDLAQCITDKLKPERNGPHPAVPTCVPQMSGRNCRTPLPTATPSRTPTVTPGP